MAWNLDSDFQAFPGQRSIAPAYPVRRIAHARRPSYGTDQDNSGLCLCNIKNKTLSVWFWKHESRKRGWRYGNIFIFTCSTYLVYLFVILVCFASFCCKIKCAFGIVQSIPGSQILSFCFFFILYRVVKTLSDNLLRNSFRLQWIKKIFLVKNVRGFLCGEF